MRVCVFSSSSAKFTSLTVLNLIYAEWLIHFATICSAMPRGKLEISFEDELCASMRRRKIVLSSREVEVDAENRSALDRMPDESFIKPFETSGVFAPPLFFFLSSDTLRC